MGLKEVLRSLAGRKAPEAAPPAEPPAKAEKPKKTCKSCGKTFSYDPKAGFVPNFCKECKQRMVKEKEEKQKSGAEREIKRKCRECGKFFTFPSTTARYPSYCSNCRKRHQAEMKAKYQRKKA